MISNKTIMIVDDTISNLDILCDFLDEYETIDVTNGEDALEVANSEHIDLILLDIMMPYMDGFEVCERLKSNPKTKDIPIIFITANTKEESIEKAFDMGGVDYVTKPFKQKELLMRIKSHLSLQHFTKSLENSVKQEKELNKQKDHLMFQQSKLAQMGEMIDAVAHQWRQPLGTIQMSMNNLALRLSMGNLEEKIVQRVVENTSTQIKHMSSTIDLFRGFFRPDNEMEEVLVKNIVDSLIVIVEYELKKNKIELIIECDESLKLYCIEDELKHVLINLINNAKDAFKDNNVNQLKQILLKVEKIDENIVVSVNDTAGGIPENIINNIFEANFTTKKDSNGTGIGLYISKMIIEKRDGRIGASNIDDGASFKIELPINI